MSDRVVVITGASSGVGRAAALELARRGDRLVLGARRDHVLAEVATQCGGDVAILRTDVTREADVIDLGKLALARFGRVDAWINNAGIALYEGIADGDVADHLRVIETNLFGAIYGTRVALPIFRAQRRGVLVNVGSVLGFVGQPFVPSYVISKFALRGLTDAARAELADCPDIHACGVYPFALDTPHFATAGNAVGREPRAIPPMQSPERVAQAIADVLDHPHRATFVPSWMALGVAVHSIAPRTTERVLLAALRRFHFAGPHARDEGNLYEPASTADATTHGHTPPIVSTPRFMAWAAARFLRELAR